MDRGYELLKTTVKNHVVYVGIVVAFFIKLEYLFI